MTPPFPFPRPLLRRGTLLALLLTGTMAIGLGACGRRGRPEVPREPAPSAQSAKPGDTKGKKANEKADAKPASGSTDASPNDDDDDNEDQAGPGPISPQPSPSGRKRGPNYLVPKEPFFLDSIL